jgi:hypothetical protein
LEALTEALGPGGAAETRANALLILSALQGALTLARAVGDSPFSREVLETVRKRIFAFCGSPKKTSARAKIKKKN